MQNQKNGLIYMKESKVKPIGGPSGYLYNLKQQLDKMGITNISYIKLKENESELRKIYDRFPVQIKKIYRIIKRNKIYRRLQADYGHDLVIDLNNYDYVHFHSTQSLFNVRNSLINYKGKVLLTSHTPKPPYLETVEDLYTDFEKRFYKKRIQTFKEIDEYAFNRADYIIFPCEEAEEPYFNNWPEYSMIKEKNRLKYRYLLSGTRPCDVKVDRLDIRLKYNIPNDAFVISYVGRHNQTKGYDVLKKIGEKLIIQDDNIYFLIAGAESPLKGLRHERWIEVGWTNDPHSLISVADVFILPNKETYFDLIMLEVLSLGKIVVASNTGGNKYFNRIKAEGVFIYGDKNEAISLIEMIKNLTETEKIRLEKANKDLYNAKFSDEVFCKNYINLVNNLV